MLGALDVDTVQEVQVLTADLLGRIRALFGRQFRFVTRAERAACMAILIENFRNSALDANTWTRNHSPLSQISAAQRPTVFNQYGFDAGGPVFIPSASTPIATSCFFFYAEEWIKRRYDTTNTGTVPSLGHAQRRFQRIAECRHPLFKRVRAINDPLNGSPFPGNIIPVSRNQP